MVLETFHAVNFAEWIGPAAKVWLIAVVALLVGFALLRWLFAVLRQGPAAGTLSALNFLWAAAADLLLISPRRTLALAGLTIKESMRRRVVIVFAVFLILVAFAGWFLDPGSNQPARLYLSFVLTTTSYLVLLLAVFLSALSLPADIRNHTIHTVVTKPVRPSEIVLGRVLGFAAVGTVLLGLMAAISYVFVLRGLDHKHDFSAAAREQLAVMWRDARRNDSTQGIAVSTDRVQNHRHTVFFDPAQETVDEQGVRRGAIRTDTENGHEHEIQYVVPAEGEVQFVCSPPENHLLARVPIYGKLRFKDRAGKDADKGVNVGDEWTYRSYIQGGSLAAAIWTFENLRDDQFPDGLPVEMTLGVFRTHKGDIEKGVPGSLSVRNPATGDEAHVRTFASREFQTDLQVIPLEFQTGDGRTINLFRDMVADGKLEVWLRCVAPQQYFGAGQADLYLRARDASFALNFVKGFAGIWLQMVMITGFGVLFSTFLSGPIAILATGGALLGGLFSDFLYQLSQHKVFGGGPIEAMIRLVTQQNVVTELPPTAQTTVAKMLDKAAEQWMWLIWHMLPDFRVLSFSDHVAYGFDISWGLLAMAVCQTLAYVGPAFVLGYVFLKSRELAQ